MARELSRGNYHGMMLNRDATIADTVEWILRREDRIVLAAHNGHILRCPATLPSMPPVTTMGMHLADRLGKDYLVIGTTSATGQTLNTAPDFHTGRLFTNSRRHLSPAASTRSWPRVTTDHSRPTCGGCRRPTPRWVPSRRFFFFFSPP